ncbi:hypothetical protein BD410DRAFT_833210 [Rickenella mellea]|uniref:Zn(2)-C6 fungal-type domain-containing protein n=1 Tax=Rickenella mellea TaxID=50990 RepID=A0A4Y7PGI2_9AGAM|nr:hypothetical protein BD410DRAFT_833210 [Rickenella mellea]
MPDHPRDSERTPFLHANQAASSFPNVIPHSTHPYPVRPTLGNSLTSRVSIHIGSEGYIADPIMAIHRYIDVRTPGNMHSTPFPADFRQDDGDRLFAQASPTTPHSPLHSSTFSRFPRNLSGGRRRPDVAHCSDIPASRHGRSNATPMARNETTLPPTFLQDDISAGRSGFTDTSPLRQYEPLPTSRGLKPQRSTSQNPGAYSFDPPRLRGGNDALTNALTSGDRTSDVRRSQRRKRLHHPYNSCSSHQEGVGPSIQVSPDTSTQSPQRAKRRASDLNWQPCGNCSKSHTKCDIAPPNSPELCKKCKTDGLSQCVPALSRKQRNIRSRNHPVSSHETANTSGQLGHEGPATFTHGIAAAQPTAPLVPRRSNVVTSSHRNGSSLPNLSQNSSPEVPESPVGNDVLQTAHASTSARSPPGRQHYGHLRNPTDDSNCNGLDTIPNRTTNQGSLPCPPCSPACRHHVRF